MAKSRKDVSELVRGGEKMVSVMAKLIAAVRGAGGTDEDVAKLDMKDNPLLEDIGRLIVHGTAMRAYQVRFDLAVKDCRFERKSERLTPVNFPDETFEIGDYDLIMVELPKVEGGRNLSEIRSIVSGMANEDPSLSPATCGDGLVLARGSLFKSLSSWIHAGFPHRGTICCVGSVSKDGGCLELFKFNGLRAEVTTPIRIDSKFVLLRKARKPMTIEASLSSTGEVAR